MPHRSRLLAAVALVALLAACGADDDDDAGTTAVAPPSTTAGADTTGDTAITSVAPAAPASGGTNGAPVDPCTLLTPEQVALVLTGPGPGEGPGAVAGPISGCEWTDAADTTSLELVVGDLGKEVGSDAAADMALAARFEPDVLAGMTPLDVGTRAVAGPEDDDVVVFVVTPHNTVQLRLWAVGAGPRPAERWSELQPAMEQLARAVVAKAGA